MLNPLDLPEAPTTDALATIGASYPPGHAVRRAAVDRLADRIGGHLARVTAVEMIQARARALGLDQ